MENFPNESPENNSDHKKEIVPTISPITAAVFGLISVFILYQFGGGLLTLAIFGFDLKNADVNALRLMQAAGQLLFILLPALILTKFVYEDVSTIIRLKLPTAKEVIIFLIGMAVLIPLLQSFLYIQNFIINELAGAVPFIESIKSIFDELDKLVEDTYVSLLTQNSLFEAIFIIIIVAVVPAICEEVFFRGFVQSSFEYKLTPFWAALASAFVFGLYHFNPYGLIGLIALGTYFGYATYKSNSILVAVILHFLNNFFAVTAFFVLGNDDFMESTSVDPANIGIYIFTFIILLTLFLLFLFLVNKLYLNQAHNNLQQNSEKGGENDLP